MTSVHTEAQGAELDGVVRGRLALTLLAGLAPACPGAPAPAGRPGQRGRVSCWVLCVLGGL